jgi:hypothetical protein
LRGEVRIPVTVAAMQWSAKGGQTVLGKVVPAVVALIGLASIAEGTTATEEQGWRASSSSLIFFVLLATLSAWLVWKFVRTSWLVVMANDSFTCLATRGCWEFGPGEILAVRGDVYHQFLHLVGSDRKVAIWGQLENRDSFLSAIRRANPLAEFPPWIQPTEQ